MDISTNLQNELARYLDLATRQIQVTSANMANIDTPGYKALGFDFEGEMRQAISSSPNDSLDRLSGGAPELFEEQGQVARPDGNTVSMDREGLSLAEAQLKFKVGVALLKHETSRINDAIHADGK